jgi:Ca-activated chloride channel family protein
MAGAKLQEAKYAAQDFVISTDLSRDRIGIVAFNSGAAVVHGLSRDLRSLLLALGEVPSRSGTRIDLGLQTAVELLRVDGRDVAIPVVILLSDGRQVIEPDRPAQIGRTARDAGITIYTIGLGNEADELTLRSIAGVPENYFFAPGIEDLRDIYRRLSRIVACRPEDYWGRRC